MSKYRPFLLAYTTLKTELLSGAHAPGTQLKASAIAKRLRLSATPVREALARLSGEKLVEERRDQGHFVPLLTARRIGELYTILGYILVATQPRLFDSATLGMAEVDGVAASLEYYARRSSNVSAQLLIRDLNDRLAVVRDAEARCVPAEMQNAIRGAIGGTDAKALRRAVTRYFAWCSRHADKIIECSVACVKYNDNID